MKKNWGELIKNLSNGLSVLRKCEIRLFSYPKRVLAANGGTRYP